MKNGIKIALIVLYAMQLTLMFRETLVHAYRFAVDHGEEEKERIARTFGGLQVLLKKAVRTHYDPHETIASPTTDEFSFLLFGFGLAADHGDSGADIEEDHRKDSKEDDRKRGRRRVPGEYLIADLFRSQLRPPRPPEADADNERGVIRMLAFCSSGC